MRTGDVARFTKRGILLTDGSEIRCDVCVLATGFGMQCFKFPLSVDGECVPTEGINSHKGVMMGGIPNYFHPLGVLHSAWTDRSERSARFAIKIMLHMRDRGHAIVSVVRRRIASRSVLTSGYLARHPEVPRIEGTFELPSLDNLLRFRFVPRQFQFASLSSG
jgi:monooxygenase